MQSAGMDATSADAAALCVPRLFTSFNDMTFGPTHAALDNLTYFEEQLGWTGLGAHKVRLERERASAADPQGTRTTRARADAHAS